MEQGLSDDYISQIVADGRGRLWFAGNRGIFSVREKELVALAEGRVVRIYSTSFGQKEGLTSLQTSYDSGSCAQRVADGRLLFAMQSGVAIVHAAGFMESTNPPPVLIERMAVNGKSVAVYGAGAALSATPRLTGRGGVRLHLAPEPRQVEFVFTSPSFTKPEAVGFRYRLQGLDEEWVEAGTRRSASYALIPPGHYRFQVTACNGNGLWNTTGASLDFDVLPYFWQTWWFLTLSASLTLVVVVGIVRLILMRRLRRRLEHLHQQNAVARERARIARDIHDDLGTSLTKISVMADGGTADWPEPAEMRVSLASIRSVVHDMTHAMDEIVWAINPHNDTLESIALYLSDYAEEFLVPAGLRLRLDIPLQLPAWHLHAAVRHNLFLAFKEALNNIVRHASAHEVQVTLHIESGRFLLVVRDDGCGFQASSGQAFSGNGLKNLQNRMAQVGGACQVESVPGQGVSVKFVVPVSSIVRRGRHENGR